LNPSPSRSCRGRAGAAHDARNRSCVGVVRDCWDMPNTDVLPSARARAAALWSRRHEFLASRPARIAALVLIPVLVLLALDGPASALPGTWDTFLRVFVAGAVVGAVVMVAMLVQTMRAWPLFVMPPLGYLLALWVAVSHAEVRAAPAAVVGLLVSVALAAYARLLWTTVGRRRAAAGERSSLPARQLDAHSEFGGAPTVAVSADDEHGLQAPPAAQLSSRPLPDVLAEVDSLIGLTDFKQRLRSDIKFIEAERIKAAHNPAYTSRAMKRHTVFAGPPGTGKTMAARLYAEALTALGLSNGRFVMTSARKLMGTDRVGGAAKALLRVLRSNAGGVVGVDEFGAVCEGGHSAGNTGDEVVQVMLDEMENNPDCPTIIVADYDRRIAAALALNDGFASRFRNRFEFPSYTPDELFAIAQMHIGRDHHAMTNDAQTAMHRALTGLYDRFMTHRSWSSARVAVTLWDKTKEAQSEALHDRLARDPRYDPLTIEEDDVLNGLAAYEATQPFAASSETS
jgi:hypothetical protein